MVTVETVCVVDVRENNPELIETPYELKTFDNPNNTTHTQAQEDFNPKVSDRLWIDWIDG